MAGVEGVITTRDTNGNLDSVTIDVKKHKEAIVALQQIGLLEKSDLRKEYESNPENFITPEQLRESLLKHIETLPWK